tara:strand:+ start:155 stop:355 length:201 start_codon:yes stop_codon:yes gene_type:complete
MSASVRTIGQQKYTFSAVWGNPPIITPPASRSFTWSARIETEMQEEEIEKPLRQSKWMRESEKERD